MNTDELITALAADLGPEPGVARGLFWSLAGAFAGCVAVVGGGLGFRDDLGAAFLTPVSVLRVVLALGLLAIGLRAVLILARPEGRGAVWPVAGVGVVAGAAVLWALATTPRGSWASEVVGETMVLCLTIIPALSVLPVLIVLRALRRGATTMPHRAGAMAGLTGAGGAAAAYALHCPDDNPLFYVAWYGVAILLVTAVSAWVGGRLLRW